MPSSSVLRIVSLFALVFSIDIASTTHAASLFTMTNLGNDYSLKQDASGSVHSVTSSDGSQTYAFEKSPVSVTETQRLSARYGPVTTLSSGNASISYEVEDRGNLHIYTIDHFPRWSGVVVPISDINPSGYVVGTLNNDPFIAYQADLTLKSAVRLFRDTPAGSGVTFTNVEKIDNLGDAIAKGTLNGADQYFLLTFNGPPTPTPEPSTLAVLVMGLVAFTVRSAHQRRG